MFRIGIILSSTRQFRRGDQVAQWVHQRAQKHAEGTGVTYEIVDLREHGAGAELDEPGPAILGEYAHQHTRDWAEVIASYDAFVVVVPEYNHGVPGSLKNAIDSLFAEWNDKAAGLVSYGINGGVRAAEHLRLVFAELKVATVRQQVALNLNDDFEITDAIEPGRFDPVGYQETDLVTMLDELVAWGTALKGVRNEFPVAV